MDVKPTPPLDNRIGALGANTIAPIPMQLPDNLDNNNAAVPMNDQNTQAAAAAPAPMMDPSTTLATATATANNTYGALFSSQSVVGKLAFLLFAIFIFIFVLKFGVTMLGFMYGPKPNPILVNGTINAQESMVISGSQVPILRSVNENDGIEFTWSVWLFINDVTQYMPNKYHCVFYKGNDFIDAASQDNATTDLLLSDVPLKEMAGVNFPNNSPGLYLKPGINTAVIFMDTFQTINEQIEVSNLPMNKWFNIIIRCSNITVDVYVNGTIVQSYQLQGGPPKQNYGNVYVCSGGGFAGFLSKLQYFNKALSIGEISHLVSQGPDKKVLSTTVTNALSETSQTNGFRYLSLRWFLGENLFASNL